MNTETTYQENVNSESTGKITDSGTLLHPVGQKKRILILDVLRGFALLGILMVNMQFFNVPFTITMGEGRLWTDPVNTGAWWFIDFFFHGKFYVLFSLLFGMGFFLFLFCFGYVPCRYGFRQEGVSCRYRKKHRIF